jgi:hypothetical protein
MKQNGWEYEIIMGNSIWKLNNYEKLINEVYHSWKNRKFKNMENKLKIVENKTKN